MDGAAGGWSPRPSGERRSGAVNRRKAILRTIRRILMLMLAILAVPLVMDAYESPNLRVGEIKVEGVRLLDPAEVAAVLPVRNRSMLQISPSDLATRVMQLPAVKAARVHFHFPGRLVVRVEERVPRGVVRVAETSLYVDETGLIIAPARDAASLVAVEYTGREQLRPGSRLDPIAISAATKLDELLREDGDVPGRRYEFAPDSGLSVVAQNGLRVLFGGDEDLPFKVEAFRAIVRTAKAQKRTVQLIDVRHGDRPYFR